MPFFSGGSDPGAARTQMGKENAAAGDFGSRGGAAWNALFPTLQQDIANPQGLTPGEKATMNTASSQSLGGSVAGVVGQGNLTAGRTKNPGSMGAALDQASARAGQQQSQNALGVEEFSTNLAQQKQQRAIQELGALYGTNTKGLTESLDAANKALGIYEQAKESESSTLGDLTQLGQFGAGIAKTIANPGGFSS